MKKPDKFAIIASIFRKEVSDALVNNCLDEFSKNKVQKSQIEIFEVPGAFEIPIMAQKIAKTKKFSSIITFGAVVKGDTYHFENIANECARGCMEVSLKYNVPIIYEVLAVYKLKDALSRATRSEDNKGREAAKIAIAMSKII